MEKEKYNFDQQWPLLMNKSDAGIDLVLVECGYEACVPDKVVPPMPKNYFTLHYVISGEGKAKCGNKTYSLKGGDLFIIYPNSSVEYQSDARNPWCYSWVVFYGRLAENLVEKCGFSRDNIFLHVERNKEVKNKFYDIVNAYQRKKEYDCECLGLLYLLLHEISKSNPLLNNEISNRESIFRNAVYFIKTNYINPINAMIVARHVNVSYNYLLIIFKEYANMTPKEYIMRNRLELAYVLIQKNEIASVSKIAKMVGFNDAKHFSRCYKKYFGFGPKEKKVKKEGGV